MNFRPHLTMSIDEATSLSKRLASAAEMAKQVQDDATFCNNECDQQRMFFTVVYSGKRRPSDRERMTTFTYKCVDCGTKNDTENPPPDNMLHCKRCGWPTVQTCEGVSKRRARTTKKPADRDVDRG